MHGDMSSSSDSCSHSFFLRRSRTLPPLHTLWTHGRMKARRDGEQLTPNWLFAVEEHFWLIHSSTFSLWISFLIWEILTFKQSISSSGIWGTGEDSDSSMVWKVTSASGIYHLQSYCCPFLNMGRHRNQGSHMWQWRWDETKQNELWNVECFYRRKKVDWLALQFVSSIWRRAAGR